MDVICDGLVNWVKVGCFDDLVVWVEYFKVFGYFFDVVMVGICVMFEGVLLEYLVLNFDIGWLV